MNNVYGKIVSVQEALSHIKSHSTVMFGGFGGIGSPPTLIQGMVDTGIEDLVLIGNDTGFPTIGIGKLIVSGAAKKVIVSHIGSNPVAGEKMTNKELEIEFSPQGTLIERIRAGGVGLGGILIDIGMDNETVTKEKKKVEVHGKTYLLETPLTADVSIIYAKKADPFGNLIYDKTAQNTNPFIAMAGEKTIAEVEEIVPLGSLNPDEIMTQGCFVDMIVQSKGVNWKWVWEKT
ncbi:CoA transferase subunit A [Priestia endophytica]|jgi:acetate CoA/acetoacetate CoA-transferase alpha subunit|uniref:CoA transferase subunit A n=1 Tax=Priestia endophytica TaxID=135735 RepID=UPI000DCA6F2B|nr:CoA transferase subunit A [Priestia endophytica]KAB2495991.1 CoA transferase subunit A [Priestia endophytica]RAS74262.1 acyl CoA:acetate/3-ketoacid CoA transferase subunit alpha [Priestia endophytica]